MKNVVLSSEPLKIGQSWAPCLNGAFSLLMSLDHGFPQGPAWCVHVCVGACSAWVHKHMCTYACGGQRATLSAAPQEHHPIFFETGSLTSLELSK